jgi:gluconate 2-dehydrogenase gamma chain
MLPSGGPTDPGARDVNAIGYLDAVLADPDIESWPIRSIREGAGKLDEAARTRGAASFDLLAPAAMDDVLRSLEAIDGGVYFLERMLIFLLEALLGDPVHGGNPGGVGWRWANHKPGFPRPKAR